MYMISSASSLTHCSIVCLNQNYMCKKSVLFYYNEILCPQLTVTATDRGTPQLTDSASLRVNIVRNTQSPIFTSPNQQYSVSVDQTLNVGGQVITVTASDGDTVVCADSSVPKWHLISRLSALHCNVLINILKKIYTNIFKIQTTSYGSNFF